MVVVLLIVNVLHKTNQFLLMKLNVLMILLLLGVYMISNNLVVVMIVFCQEILVKKYMLIKLKILTIKLDMMGIVVMILLNNIKLFLVEWKKFRPKLMNQQLILYLRGKDMMLPKELLSNLMLFKRLFIKLLILLQKFRPKIKIFLILLLERKEF